MGVFRVAEAEPLAAEEVPLVREMADRAAMAIERARLFEEQRRSNERLGLLADAGTLMAQSLDVRAALVSFVRLAVTSFAHACVVLIFERGRVSSAVAAHDPGLEGATQRAVDRYASATKPPAEIRRVFEAGRAELVRPVDERLLQGLAVDDAQVELLRALALRSMIVVPLTARGVTIGVVAFGRTSDPAYDDDDLGFAQELGRRAALAIDNARLFRKATEAVALRDEFLSIASHELNTPLTPLKMQLDSLRRGNFPPERVAEKLDAASRQVTRLAKLVGELLDVSRIRIGKLHLEPEPLDLATLLDDAVARMRDEAERSGSRVVVTAERPCTGTWDRTRLDQVVTNLLTNAIKYGGGKPIEITLGCTATGARLVVRDHGIGISPRIRRASSSGSSAPRRRVTTEGSVWGCGSRGRSSRSPVARSRSRARRARDRRSWSSFRVDVSHPRPHPPNHGSFVVATPEQASLLSQDPGTRERPCEGCRTCCSSESEGPRTAPSHCRGLPPCDDSANLRLRLPCRKHGETPKKAHEFTHIVGGRGRSGPRG